jgi:hypothetical protein
MMNDSELTAKIEQVTKDFDGQLDNLYETVGMIMLGRLMGWRVMRLVSSRRCWKMASDLFGDPKLIMPERGKYYKKSIGLQIIDSTGHYWDYIKKIKPMDINQRKFVSTTNM